MTSPASILGTRVVRTEDPLFLTRGAIYTDDVVDDRLRGAVHVTFVRSHMAHARINAIDFSAAENAAGFVAAFCVQDLDLHPPRPMLPTVDSRFSRPAMADGVVRFVGEPVAVVVTQELNQGEDVAELVEVEYEPLPAVVDPRIAAEDSVLLFPDVGTNVAAEFRPEHQNPHLFDDCEVVVTHEMVNQRIAPAPMETRAAAAVWGADGRLTAWIPNQGAQGTKAVLVAWLGVDAGMVRGDHSRRRRRVRREVRRRPGTRRYRRGRQEARQTGPLDGVSLRQPARDDPRAGSGADGDDGRQSEWQNLGLPVGDPAGLWCVPSYWGGAADTDPG